MFRTTFLLDQSGLNIDRTGSFLFLGSCFAQEIGTRLQTLHLSVSVNPTGIAFNPVSLADHIEGTFDMSDCVHHRGIWHSMKHHSAFSAASEDILLENIQQAQRELRQHLEHAQLITFTFGTAFVHCIKETDRVAANCHRIPADHFEKRLLSTAEMAERWNKVISNIHRLNPSVSLLFSVSPVRHIKDGLIENTRSKARLIELVHQLVQSHNHAHYFPAYELLLDDLRDYRFYKTDMLHPSEEAVDYIFDKWKHRYCAPSLIQYMREVEKYQNAVRHKTRFDFGEDHQLYQDYLRKEQNRLKGLYPEHFN